MTSPPPAPRPPSGIGFAAVAMGMTALVGVGLVLLGNAAGLLWVMLAGVLAIGLAPLWLLRPLIRPRDEREH